MKKNQGFFVLELILTLGLLSIFSLLIFPLLRVSHTLNSSLIKQSLFEKDGIKILSLIETSIEESNISTEEYIGKKYIENGAIVLNYNKEIYSRLDEDFFRKKTTKGNVLFLEFPKSDGINIYSSFLIYHLYFGELIVIECEKFGNEIYITNSNSIHNKIYGYFEKNKNGIIINLEILDSYFSKNRNLRGYANFKKTIKK